MRRLFLALTAWLGSTGAAAAQQPATAGGPIEPQPATASETISIHEPEIRISAENLQKALVVRLGSPGQNEVTAGTQVEASRIDLVLTNVHVEGRFQADLRRLRDLLRAPRQPRQNAPDDSKQSR
jgi:hypothetical protein